MKVNTKKKIFYVSILDGTLHFVGKVKTVDKYYFTTENGTKFMNKVFPCDRVKLFKYDNDVFKYLIK